jgi:hypothetical protein
VSAPEAGGRPAERARLERRYRRLLSWYPAAHRREHEQEMLGVLLAAARDGQRRPRPSEAVNLIGGALRIRLRRAPVDARLATWRDALAVYSVAAPLLAVMMAVGSILLLKTTGQVFYPLPIFGNGDIGVFAEGQFVLAVLVLLRLRRTAAVLALGEAVFFAAGSATHWDPQSAGYAFALVLVLSTAAALISSPGPRRGFELLRGRRLAFLVVAGGALAVMPFTAGPGYFPGPAAFRVAAIAAIAALLAGLTVTSALTRCLLLLFAIPGVPLAYLLASNIEPGNGITAELFLSPPAYYLAGFFVLPVLAAGLIVTAAVRTRRRGEPGGAS